MDVLDDRKSDGEDDPLLDPDDDDGGRRDGGHDDFALPEPIDVGHPLVVDEPEADEEDDGRQDGVRHVGERDGQEQQDNDDDRRRRQLRDLVLPPALSTISVFVGLPLTTKVPEIPAARLAVPRPTRSTFSSKRSEYFIA